MASFEHLSDDQSAEIRELGRTAAAPVADLEKSYMSGADLNMPKFDSSQARIGYGIDPAQAEAIYRKAGAPAQAQFNADKVNMRLMARNDKFKRMEKAAMLTSAELQHNNRVDQMRAIERANRRRARAAVLGNVLGIGGAVAGGFAGGPAGAMAGYSIGQGVGQSIGGGE